MSKRKKSKNAKPAVRKPETEKVVPESIVTETEAPEAEAPETEQPKSDTTPAETETQTKRSKISKIFNRAATVLLVLSLGLLIYVTVCVVRGKPVWIANRCVLHVITGSMEPTLHVGDCIIMEKVAPAQLAAGEIIAYVSEANDVKGRIVTHRFVHRQANGNLLTRGDANPVSDLEIRPDQVVGVYIRKSPFFTWMMSFGDLRKVLMLVVMLTISAVALYEARTVVLIGKEVNEENAADAEAEREQLMRAAIDREIERLKAEAAQNNKKDGDGA